MAHWRRLAPSVLQLDDLMISRVSTHEQGTTEAAALPLALARGPVLVASDGSRAADAAMRLARRLEVAHNATAVHVITAIEPLAAGGPGPELAALDARMDEERRAHLQGVIAEQVERVVPGTSWPVQTVWGNPAHIIAATAVERGASLVLLGLTHHTRLQRILGGETALAVIRHSSVPVMLVSEGATELPRIIVVGIDFSRGSILAAQTALELFGEAGGELHLVHVRPAVEMPADKWEAWDVAYAAGVPALISEVRAMLGDRPGVRMASVQLRGQAKRDLLDYSQQVGADAIAVASHGHGAMERMLVGSTTAGLVRAATCCVLVVPALPGGRALGVPYADSAATGKVK